MVMDPRTSQQHAGPQQEVTRPNANLVIFAANSCTRYLNPSLIGRTKMHSAIKVSFTQTQCNIVLGHYIDV